MSTKNEGNTSTHAPTRPPEKNLRAYVDGGTPLRLVERSPAKMILGKEITETYMHKRSCEDNATYGKKDMCTMQKPCHKKKNDEMR